MARPTKQRRICKAPAYCEFGPIGKVDDQEPIVLDVTEYECLRLIDYEGLTQEECAKQMNLVRTSVTGIYARARQKIADSLVNGKELWIEGGSYEVCEGGLESCPSRKEREKCSQCSKEHTGSR